MELEEYLEVTRYPHSFARRKSKGSRAEHAAFGQFLSEKSVEQKTEGVLEAFTEGEEGDDHVYLNSLYFNTSAFPCSSEYLKALQALKKKVRLTVKLEILD